MPELPEVETIRRKLRDGRPGQPSIVGRTITGARVLWARSIAVPDASSFVQQITGQMIQDVKRRGKYFVIPLSIDTLLIHLRMSGDVFVEPVAEQEAPHHRVMLDLDNEYRIAFNNPRKFGRMWLVNDPADVLGNLGPEPLDPGFTGGELNARLQRRSRQLKALLLDQHFIAGLGNIYVDEALFCARLHPTTPANAINLQQTEVLLACIRSVLEAGIQQSGASIDWIYRGGGFQNEFNVYQRTGEACFVCGNEIQRILVAQRGTHFCPQCQPNVVK